MNTLLWNHIPIPVFVLGTAQLGLPYGIANAAPSHTPENAREIVKAALEAGIRFFDTARAYGNSEEALGKNLSLLKEKAQIITKTDPSLNPKELLKVKASVEESLQRLKVKQIFGLLLHRSSWLEFWNQGLGETLSAFRSSGQIGFLGVSVYTPDEALLALEIPEIDLLQIPMNLWDAQMSDRGVLSRAQTLGKLCFVRSLYLQGLLLMEEASVKQKLPMALEAHRKWKTICRELGTESDLLSLRYGLSLGLPLVIGADNPLQIRKNAKLLSELSPLEKEKIEWIRKEMNPYLTREILNPSLWKTVK